MFISKYVRKSKPLKVRFLAQTKYRKKNEIKTRQIFVLMKINRKMLEFKKNINKKTILL